MRTLVSAAVAAVAITAASPASAVDLTIDPATGKLTGATGVNINGTLYDVNFVDGTCSNIFNGCDSNSDFDFTDATVLAAGQALLSQVFNQTVGGINYDTSYAMTAGCSINADNLCSIVIPSSLANFTNPWANATGVANFAVETSDRVLVGYGASPNFNSTASSGWTWADFYLHGTTPPVYGVAAVPEPATWAMMLMGFGAIGFSMRRERKQMNVQAL